MKPKVDRVVVAVLLVAALVRFPGLGKRSLWFDEALSGLIARLSTGEVLTNAAGSSHPPGYYFLLHLWRPMGESEFALRFPSAWFSLLAVALVVRLGRDFFDRRTARLAALGMAISPFQVYYAQEARMYGLAIALSAGLVWAFLHGMQRNGYEHWWLYVILTALGLYVHYYIGLVVLALHLWLLRDWSRSRKVLPALLVADVLIGLAFLPQLMEFRMEADEFLGYARWRVAPNPLEPLRALHYLIFGHSLPLELVPAGLFLVLGLLGIGVFTRRTWHCEIGILLLTVVLVPIILVLVISLCVNPVYVERSFAVVTPALVLLLARYARDPYRRSPAPYLGTALCVLLFSAVIPFHARADPAKPPVREAAETVTRGARPTDVILHLQDASYVPALYYDSAEGGTLLNAGQRLWLAPEIYRLLDGKTIEPTDLTLTGRAWIVLMPGYLDAAQTEFLEDWDARRTIIKTWGWKRSGPGQNDHEWVRVRLYGPGETE